MARVRGDYALMDIDEVERLAELRLVESAEEVRQRDRIKDIESAVDAVMKQCTVTVEVNDNDWCTVEFDDRTEVRNIVETVLAVIGQ